MQIPFLFRCVRTFWNTEPTHIYDRHVDIIKELISRKPPLPAPKVTLNPDITNFYDFMTKDILIENYETYEQIRNIPIAV